VTLAHLLALRCCLNLNDIFDAAVYVTATVAFWCQCHLGEVCIENTFNPILHASHLTPQKSGKTSSNVIYHSFWAPSTKTKLHSKYIMWTDSGCQCSTEWAFNNHNVINSCVPQLAHLFTFETNSDKFLPMHKTWFLSWCNEVWTAMNLNALKGHSFQIWWDYTSPVSWCQPLHCDGSRTMEINGLSGILVPLQ